MTDYPYENEKNPLDEAPKPQEQAPDYTAGIEEETFDISTFDFSIADPWENETEPEAAPVPREESRKPEEKPKKKPLSWKGISDKISDAFDDKPREEPVKKPRKQKPEPAAVRMEEEPPLPMEKPPRKKLSLPRLTKEEWMAKGRRWIRYALRPSMLYENIQERLWPLFLAATALFSGMLYLLIGLDWHRAEMISSGRLWAFVFVGLLLGGTMALAFGAGAQILSLICKKETLRPFKVLSAVGGAAIFPGLLLVLGLLIRLIFGAAVSMSFGITALLWWIYILLEALRDIFGEKNLYKSALFTTLWGFLLFCLMTLTFSLK